MLLDLAIHVAELAPPLPITQNKSILAALPRHERQQNLTSRNFAPRPHDHEWQNRVP